LNKNETLPLFNYLFTLKFVSMNLLRDRLHHLTTQLPEIITKLPDESLPDAWKVLQPIYDDLYMLGAMQESMRTLRPGDVLTREEALLLLQFP
jgi:hypothetical protein